MVEYYSHHDSLDSVFGSLADPTRRNILRRVSRKPLSIGEVASHYSLSLAAVSKHIKVLEEAKLVHKHKRGREHFIVLFPPALREAEKYLKWYERLWNERLDSLENYLKDNQ